MRARNYQVVALFLAAVAVTAIPALAQDQGREFHWTGKLAADKVVEIKNLNGTIQAEPTSGDQIEVNAEKIGPHAEEVRIEVVPHSDGVTICAIYPSGSLGASSGPCEPGGHWHSSSHHGENVKVNFMVRLPENLRFSAENINGEIRAEDMGRFVHADSVNGSIQVSTKAWAQLESVNGSIDARMGRANWDGTLKLSTVNGSIKLEVPSDMNADVQFRSVNGHLQSDFPLTVSGTVGGRKVDGRIGSGGRELVLETVNGNVELRRAGI
jgi:Putative adhesin